MGGQLNLGIGAWWIAIVCGDENRVPVTRRLLKYYVYLLSGGYCCIYTPNAGVMTAELSCSDLSMLVCMCIVVTHGNNVRTSLHECHVSWWQSLPETWMSTKYMTLCSGEVIGWQSHVLQCQLEIQTLLNDVHQQFCCELNEVSAAMNEYIIVIIQYAMNNDHVAG